MTHLVGEGLNGIADIFAAGWCDGHTSAMLGTLDANRNLTPDDQPGISIPPSWVHESGYFILRFLGMNAVTTTGTVVADHGAHTHTLPSADLLQGGDRVVFVWIGPRPVVLGTI